MRNGIKIKDDPNSTKETHHGSLFLTAGLLDGNPHRALRNRGGRPLSEVDPKSKSVLQDNSDFLPLNPLGPRPDACAPTTARSSPRTPPSCSMLRIAFRTRGIGAADGIHRSRLRQWLCFIGTELHKGLFQPLLDRKAPAEMKAYVLEKYLSRLDVLNRHLEGREFLLDHFSVADAYLGTVLNWTMATPPIDLTKWPAINDYLTRFRVRPSVAKALAEELVLFKAEVARHKAVGVAISPEATQSGDASPRIAAIFREAAFWIQPARAKKLSDRRTRARLPAHPESPAPHVRPCGGPRPSQCQDAAAPPPAHRPSRRSKSFTLAAKTSRDAPSATTPTRQTRCPERK